MSQTTQVNNYLSPHWVIPAFEQQHGTRLVGAPRWDGADPAGLFSGSGKIWDHLIYSVSHV